MLGKADHSRHLHSSPFQLTHPFRQIIPDRSTQRKPIHYQSLQSPPSPIFPLNHTPKSFPLHTRTYSDSVGLLPDSPNGTMDIKAGWIPNFPLQFWPGVHTDDCFWRVYTCVYTSHALCSKLVGHHFAPEADSAPDADKNTLISMHLLEMESQLY
ncbi:hypothetical protein AVEN_79320-1 [Araneus ventricosus]|uniref:Uncharacterized protein n=1 Tax=Araneus ventricosus TaxID=182803 RepID=A0A4Y2JYF5_ARAVE|nr:hypothetical protein AVEN_79320-1 [Araneus ventricosus]